MTPNRIVAGAVALLGLLTLLTGLLADMGSAPEVAALAAGAILLLTPAVVWLRGWQAYEARQGEADQPVGWEDLREQMDRVLGALGSLTPGGGAEVATAAVSEIGFVATRLTEALQASRPAVPPADSPPAAAEDPADLDRRLAEVADQEPGPEDLTVAHPGSLPPEERGAP